MLFDIISKVASESKKKQKEVLLKENESEVLKEILYYTYNSFITYGIKSIDFEGINSGNKNLIDNWEPVKELLDKLAERRLTGNAARDEIINVASMYVSDEQTMIKRIINRDMEAGFSESTVNKVWEGLIPVFDVALAERYDKFPQLLTFDGAWLLSRKLDGCRCIAIVDPAEYSVKFYSRQGIEFTTLRMVANEIMATVEEADDDDESPIGKFVLDGEICLIDKEGNEDFQGIMKQIKKKDHTIKNPMYQIFDFMTYDDFLNKKSIYPLSKRLRAIRRINEGEWQHIKVLEQVVVDSEEVFAEWNKKVADNGWEGLILRKDVPYEGKRTKNMLKVKKFFDAEYVVKDIITGDFNYSVAGQGQAKEEMLTAVIIEHKGHEVRVGSGWSIEQRKEFFSNPEKIIGKTITVQYFEETKNKEGGLSLRFPTLKVIHGETRDT
jgi:DNA ligase-1